MKKLIFALIAIAGLFTADTAQAEGKRFVTAETIGTSNSWTHYPAVTITANQYIRIYGVYNTSTSVGNLSATINGTNYTLKANIAAAGPFQNSNNWLNDTDMGFNFNTKNKVDNSSSATIDGQATGQVDAYAKGQADAFAQGQADAYAKGLADGKSNFNYKKLNNNAFPVTSKTTK